MITITDEGIIMITSLRKGNVCNQLSDIEMVLQC